METHLHILTVIDNCSQPPHLLLNLNNNKKEKEAAAAKKVSAAIIFMSIINGCFYMFLWHPR